MDSLWNQACAPAHRPPLTGHIRADAAVIGAGMTGILTAQALEKQGLKVILLEADRIGSGQTEGTTAKITSQHGMVYKRLLKELGTRGAALYAKAGQQTVSAFGRLIEEQKIDCEFERCYSYLYSRFSSDALSEEMNAARAAGIPARLVHETELPFSVKAALEFPNQARFHPEKFIKALARHMEIYEKTPVLKVLPGKSYAEDSRLLTPRGTVSAKHVIFACHFPFVNFPGFYFLKMHQERSYVMALTGAPRLAGNYLCTDAGGWSMRSYGDYLILGGGNHRAGAFISQWTKADQRSGPQLKPRDSYSILREFASKYWPDAKEIARWSAQDCMTLDGRPYIGRFAKSRPNWYVATGFGKWGMSHSMTAALLIADLIFGTPSPYEALFAPGRFSLLPSLTELGTNGYYTARSFSKRLLPLPLKTAGGLPRGTAAVVLHNGRKRGAYKDENGRIFTVPAYCPHLGCQLEWNPAEKTWDCPCHGSRFDYKGNLLNNPAQEDLRHETFPRL